MKSIYQNGPYSQQEVTLLDILDGVLDKGVVLSGKLIISVADIDLVYIDLRLLVTSVETALGRREGDLLDTTG